MTPFAVEFKLRALDARMKHAKALGDEEAISRLAAERDRLTKKATREQR